MVRTHQRLAGVHGSVSEFMWAGYGAPSFGWTPKRSWRSFSPAGFAVTDLR